MEAGDAASLALAIACMTRLRSSKQQALWIGYPCRALGTLGARRWALRKLAAAVTCVAPAGERAQCDVRAVQPGRALFCDAVDQHFELGVLQCKNGKT